MAKNARNPDDESDIADASQLLGEGTPRGGKAPERPRAAKPVEAGGYDLEGADEVDEGVDESPPVPIPTRAAPSEGRKRKSEPEEVEVDQVWSRAAEWWPTIAVLVVGILAVVFVFRLSWASSGFTLPILVLILGASLLLALAYPIFITLERPVRMTPEQAAKDYYDALSHFLPHYRRMWLLLSPAGRESRSFHSLSEFRAYWKKVLSELRGGNAKGFFTPITFQVVDFRSEKSAGKKAIDGKYTVAVLLEGKEGNTPLGSFPVESSFARGPDNMWYLNRGTLE